jgi:hypothetical protein
MQKSIVITHPMNPIETRFSRTLITLIGRHREAYARKPRARRLKLADVGSGASFQTVVYTSTISVTVTMSVSSAIGATGAGAGVDMAGAAGAGAGAEVAGPGAMSIY